VVTGGAHGLGNLSDPSSGRPGHPSGKSPPRSRGPAPYHRNSASLEGWMPPRAKLCLARGLDAPLSETPPRSGIDAPSGESSPRSRPSRARGIRAHSLNQRIKCPNTTPALGSEANPRHAGALTPPGNRIPTLFHQLALCGSCAQGRRQIRDTVPPTLVRSPRRTPRGRTAEPSKEVQMPTPRSGRTMP
jgi:hypothetical protein